MSWQATCDTWHCNNILAKNRVGGSLGPKRRDSNYVGAGTMLIMIEKDVRVIEGGCQLSFDLCKKKGGGALIHEKINYSCLAFWSINTFAFSCEISDTHITHRFASHTSQININSQLINTTMGKYACLCCGYKTLKQKPPGTYSLCPVCYWEDDQIQGNDPDYEGGANQPSLRQAQEHFRTLGACDPRSVKSVRKPTAEEQRDPNWKFL